MGGYRDQPWHWQMDMLYCQMVEAWIENEAPTRAELEAVGIPDTSKI